MPQLFGVAESNALRYFVNNMSSHNHVLDLGLRSFKFVPLKSHWMLVCPEWKIRLNYDTNPGTDEISNKIDAFVGDETRFTSDVLLMILKQHSPDDDD